LFSKRQIGQKLILVQIGSIVQLLKPNAATGRSNFGSLRERMQSVMGWRDLFEQLRRLCCFSRSVSTLDSQAWIDHTPGKRLEHPRTNVFIAC